MDYTRLSPYRQREIAASCALFMITDCKHKVLRARAMAGGDSWELDCILDILDRAWTDIDAIRASLFVPVSEQEKKKARLVRLSVVKRGKKSAS